MAATETVPQPAFPRKSPLSRSGVLTLTGFGIKVRMQSGHLEIEDGLGPDRRKIRLARVGHGLKRLVCTGSDGFVSLAALCWLADQDAAFTMLERDGKVLVVTGPVRSSDAKLRRAQALAHSYGAALRIARELISQKLTGQEQVARHKLLESATADTIAQFKADLPHADAIATIRLNAYEISSVSIHQIVGLFELWISRKRPSITGGTCTGDCSQTASVDFLPLPDIEVGTAESHEHSGGCCDKSQHDREAANLVVYASPFRPT